MVRSSLGRAVLADSGLVGSEEYPYYGISVPDFLNLTEWLPHEALSYGTGAAKPPPLPTGFPVCRSPLPPFSQAREKEPAWRLGVTVGMGAFRQGGQVDIGT